MAQGQAVKYKCDNGQPFGFYAATPFSRQVRDSVFGLHAGAESIGRILEVPCDLLQAGAERSSPSMKMDLSPRNLNIDIDDPLTYFTLFGQIRGDHAATNVEFYSIVLCRRSPA